MSDSRKKRLSILDSMAAASSTPPAPASAPATKSMMATNRALRSARDAVDGHNVWELDPHQIDDDRIRDRLDPEDVADLRDSIEATGQTVPILVRRHPEQADRYLLVYGRRRLEAIRDSDKVDKVRALVANLDEDAAVKAQVSENMARRDLSYIEKALFARELVDSGFGTQQQVADVLTVTKSSISMALAIVEGVGPDLARAIGPAHGVGRPRWDALVNGIAVRGLSSDALIDIADKARNDAVLSVLEEDVAATVDPSMAAFEAVFDAVEVPQTVSKKGKKPTTAKTKAQRIKVGAGVPDAEVRRTKQGVSLHFDDSAFADWLERQAGSVLKELHQRWKTARED